MKLRSIHYLPLAFVVTFAYFYRQDGLVATSVLYTAIQFALPLALAAMVGIMCERTGIVNIGIEGTMLISAFTAFFAGAILQNTGRGMIVGVLTGVIMGLLLAVMAITWKMDQIIAGVILNILAAGVTSFYYRQNYSIPSTLDPIDLPVVGAWPILGPVLSFHGPITYFGVLIVFTLWFALYKTSWGLRSRAVGEHPSSADTAGVSVTRLRYLNVTIAGAVGGLAGSYLALEAVGIFERGFTAGKGFTALAIMIFGRWNPLGAFAAALFFGLTQALTNQLMIAEVVEIPFQFVTMLPYILTILILAISAGKVRPPAAEGIPYEKEKS
ncbi:MAG: ABC transporter permease [Actinobacteria bacterium]|nr:ABC transporter permease [Actinomycetota bacterium]